MEQPGGVGDRINRPTRPPLVTIAQGASGTGAWVTKPG